ncbi:MAG: penicillin-binding protein activator [Nitratireductor sp.]|nr:penicillin-binding protein activator [Nitratireductor sp.]
MVTETMTTSAARRLAARLAAGLLLVLALASCQSANLGSATEGLGSEQATIPLDPNPQGEVFGQGQVRVTLLIPKTAPGNAATVANDLRNGALLAMQDFGQDTIQLVIKDTKGTAAEAQTMATEAINEGSSAILGPLFSGSVSSASAVTLPAGKTMIAFSNDPSVARRGAYLLSYTQSADTTRLISYAMSLGKRSIHAFLPTGAVGVLQEAALRQAAGAGGATVQVSKYERSGPGIEAAVREAVASVETADTIYIPEGGQIPEVILSSLNRSGASLQGKQVLGSGQWESVKFGRPELEGALYTGRDITNFNGFASRYQSTYNQQPGLFAGLAYDALTLAINLIKTKGPQQAFQPASIEDRRGFTGINGVFRMKADGTSERGLAIYKVVNGQGTLESPAPTRFAGS